MFDFVAILQLNVSTEEILDFSFYYFINQKILSTDRKQIMFLAIKCCIKSVKWYMNKPHSKNLQNIEKNKTAKFGVYIISAAEAEKKTFKYMDW